MAFTLIQKDTNSVFYDQTRTFTIVPTSPTTVNSLVVIGCRFVSGNGITNVTATDDKGNSYSLVAITETSNKSQACATLYGLQIIGGVTQIYVSVTSVSNPYSRAYFSEFGGYGSGLTNAVIYDTYSAISTLTITLNMSVPSFNPSRSRNLIVSNFGLISGGTNFTAGTNYTRMGSGSGSINQDCTYRLSSGSSETAPASVASTGGGYSEIAVSFKEMPTGPFPTYLQN